MRKQNKAKPMNLKLIIQMLKDELSRPHFLGNINIDVKQSQQILKFLQLLNNNLDLINSGKEIQTKGTEEFKKIFQFYQSVNKMMLSIKKVDNKLSEQNKQQFLGKTTNFINHSRIILQDAHKLKQSNQTLQQLCKVLQNGCKELQNRCKVLQNECNGRCKLSVDEQIYLQQIQNYLIYGKMKDLQKNLQDTDKQKIDKMNSFEKFIYQIGKQFENFSHLEEDMLKFIRNDNNNYQECDGNKATLSERCKALLNKIKLGFSGLNIKVNDKPQTQNILTVANTKQSNNEQEQPKNMGEQQHKKQQNYNQLLKGQKNKWEEEKSKLNQKITSLANQLTNLRQQLKNTLFQKDQQIRRLEQQLKNKQKEYQQLKNSSFKSTEEKKKNDGLNKEINKENDNLKRLAKEKQNLVNKNNQVIQKQQTQIQELQQKVQNQKRQNKQLRENVGNIEAQFQQRIKQLQNENAITLKKEIDKLKEMLKKTKQENQKQKQQNQKLKQEFNATKQKVQSNNKTIQKQNKSKQELKTEIQKKQHKLQNINSQIKDKKISYGKFPNRNFIGDLIKDEEDRQFIIDNCEELHNRKIGKTKLIYSFSLMEGINIHEAIDNFPNYIIIMTLKNCDEKGKPYMLAMYSQRPLNPQDKTLNTDKGFVASVTNRQTFYMIKNDKDKDKSARLTEYNDYYIVFGKGQLQFKMDYKSNIVKLQLNIGHNYKAIDTGNLKGSLIFTGQQSSQSQIAAIEIYQIIFEQ